MNKEIQSAVRKSAAAAKAQTQNAGGLFNLGTGIGTEGELKKILMQKVDKQEVEALIDLKSNKHDTDQTMKAMDIIHKQITHMIVLMIEIVKGSMNALSIANDSDKTKHHKNLMYLLSQTVNVCRWINEFDPQNVNSEDLYLP